ncbi:MAG TPA: hypothetical protein VG737_09000 [Cyclobacteriaceae bacterium]|nr:hypothetical protein [Cyclobacteriaceae bacterium]
MISCKDFQLQSLSKQIVLLYEHGSCVMSIRYYGYKVNLYLLGNFYLEVFYNHKKDLIEKIIPLDMSHSRMDFYAAQIKLPVSL